MLSDYSRIYNFTLLLLMALKLYYSILLDHILSHTTPILVSDNILSMFYTTVNVRVSVSYLKDPVYI